MNVSEKKQPRICIVSDQLATGGAERCAANLSIFFEKNNCKVHHVIVVDKIEYSFSGEVLNLGKLKNKTNGFFNRLKRFLVLKQFFKNNKFDYIIDFRVRSQQLQEFIIIKFIYNAPLIISIRSFMIDLYFPKNKLLANTIFSQAKKIITVSQAIENRISKEFSYSQLQTIYNPIDFDLISRLANEELNLDFEYVLAVGRMNDDVKQFDKLIEVYANSELPLNNIKLIFLGDGSNKEKYELQVFNNNLKGMIYFKGKVDNPFMYMKNAKFLLLSSKNEGFPNVILETLACGTPVVSFDCESGPNEIIINRENGLLVENQNFEAFKISINEMALNEELYNNCKANSKASVQQFSIDMIGRQWLELMKIN